MKRFETGGRVVYVDRRRWPSLTVFALALAFVASGVFFDCPCGLAERHWIPILAYALPLSLLAVGLLLQERRWVIDPASGTGEYIRRGLFGRLLERRIATSDELPAARPVKPSK